MIENNIICSYIEMKIKEIPKKNRRTKKELDNVIWEALDKLIEEEGFNNITFQRLAHKAGVKPLIIYNRFKNLDELFEKYTKKHDYWLNDITKLDENYAPKENFKKILAKLVNELYDNKIMRQVLLWELITTNKTTQSIALRRELEAVMLLRYMDENWKQPEPNFSVLNSLIIAGISYLVLRQNISPFCTVNFNMEHGKELLINTIETIIDKLYSEDKERESVKDIAKKLLARGVDKNIVRESFGFTEEEINNILTN